MEKLILYQVLWEGGSSSSKIKNSIPNVALYKISIKNYTYYF